MANKTRKRKTNKKPMLFTATNYKLMALGTAMIIIGFVVMYIENEVLGFFSLYLCPIVILGGYGVVLMSLLKTFDTNASNSQTASS